MFSISLEEHRVAQLSLHGTNYVFVCCVFFERQWVVSALQYLQELQLSFIQASRTSLIASMK